MCLENFKYADSNLDATAYYLNNDDPKETKSNLKIIFESGLKSAEGKEQALTGIATEICR